MKFVALSELASVSAGQSAPKSGEFSESGKPFVRAGSLEALLEGKKESALELVSPEVVNKRKLKLYPKGTILFAKSGMSATKDRVYCLRSPAYIVSHLAALIPNDATHGDYLRLALKAFPPSSLINDPAYPAISLGSINGFKIPVPSDIDEQRKIAAVLGKVEGLIAQRKQHLAWLDDLLKSVFLDMFGDPVRNEKGWNKVQFSELLDRIESGKSPKCKAREAGTNEWGVLKLGAVTRCTFDASENKALPEDVPPPACNEIVAGDLLFSRKNTYSLVAACAYVYETRPMLLMPDLIFRFVFNDTAKVNKIFIWKLLTDSSQRKAIQSLAAGAAGSMPNISKAKLKTIRLPIPPQHLQDQFAVTAEKIEALKNRYQHNIADLETLYAVLSQSAFKGELDLSRVPLPESVVEEMVVDHAQAKDEVMDKVVPAGLPEYEALSTASGRSDTLRQWLDAGLGFEDVAGFDAGRMLDAAQERLAAAFPDEDDIALTADDYETIKRWAFEQLRKGRLAQTLDESTDTVKVAEARG